MRILIFILVLFGTSLQAQNVLTCYDYSDFLQSDCVGCGLKDSTFSGILLVKNGTIYQPLVKPIKIKTRPNILDLEDGFATRVSIYIDQITTYNTEASVLAFLRSCVAVESITIGDVTTIIHDSLATLQPDSLYLQGDSLILLRDGNGQVYKNRIYMGYDNPSDYPNPKKYDIFIENNQPSYWYDGSEWQFLDQDTDKFNEGDLSLHNIAANIAALRSNTNYVNAKKFVGRHGVTINTNELDSLNIGIDTSLIATTYDLTLKQNLLNGVSPRIPYFTSATTLGTNANFWWDNTYTELVIKDRLFGSFATGQLYVGLNSGYNATSAIHSNFLSDGAGYAATNAAYSNFFGKDAGFQSVSAPYSNFLGRESGYQATNATHSNFMGYRSGRASTNASYSFFVGDSTGMSATNAKHSNFFGYRAGYGATNAKYSFFAGDSTGMSATGAEYSNFIGLRAGYNASNAYWSNFFGRDAGSGATQAFYSNFIGYKAGSSALLSYGSNFIGYLSGYGSETSEYSNFVGHSAGWSCLLCPNSNYIGKNAGYGATGSSESNFMGFNAGNGATYAYGSNFFGYNAGNSSSAEYSNFFGSWAGMDQNDASYSTFIGYRAGEGTVGRYLGANNIIIGTNINLPENSSNAMSIGNVLYGTGFKYDPTDADSTQYISTLGKIGILVTDPTQQLHVNGNIRVEDAYYDSNNEPGTAGQILSSTVTGTDWIAAPTFTDTDDQTLTIDSLARVFTLGITEGNTVKFQDQVNDADANPTNEIQDLSLSGNTLSLSSDPSTVDLSPYLDNTDDQNLTLLDSINRVFRLQIEDGNIIKFKDQGITTEVDGDVNNEIQDLSLTGNTLSLSSDPSTVDLAPYLDNTDGQTLSLTDSTNRVFTLGISGGNTVKFKDNVNDADADPTNEIQYLNPYILLGDTIGFYQTIGQDTVVFLSTLDTTSVSYIDSTIVTEGYGITVIESPANTFTVIADTSQLATPYDLTLIDTDNQTLTLLDSVNRVFRLQIDDGNIIKFKDTGFNFTVRDPLKLVGATNPYLELTQDTYGDIEVSGDPMDATKSTVWNVTANSITSGKILDNTVGNADIRQGAAKSVIGVAGNSMGNVADIVSTGADQVLRVNTLNNVIGWGQVATAGIADNAITAAKIGTNEVGSDEIASTGVGAGSYSRATITVDVDGRITAASSGVPFPDSTIVAAGWGTTVTESPLNTFTVFADTSKVATKYDLTQVSGSSSSKVIDILGSDFTTSATSLQSTALTYTFPSTGTYEVKVYGSYTVSNTANGINFGYIDSGGLVASYITGKHMAFTNNTSSSSTETRKPISAIGTTLSTASVGASSTQYTVMSEALITVSTAGTITVGFASGSGSYSATLQAGSSLIVEKLN